MKYKCSQSRFLNDVTNHEMTIVQDDGVHRHVTFKRPGTYAYRFDIITWPGELCITGDMGTYVFNRLADMFEFFRTDRIESGDSNQLHINAGYWGEKLVSICKSGGYRKFDAEKFRERVTEYFHNWKESRPCDADSEEIDNLWQEIEDSVLRMVDDGEPYAYQALYDFEHNGFMFEDFFDGGGTESYTFHYIWICYAIAWAVKQYDDFKNTAPAEKTAA